MIKYEFVRLIDKEDNMLFVMINLRKLYYKNGILVNIESRHSDSKEYEEYELPKEFKSYLPKTQVKLTAQEFDDLEKRFKIKETEELLTYGLN